MAYTNAMTQYQIRKDFSYAIAPSTTINTFVLSAGSAKTIDLTIADPSGIRAGMVFFSANGDFYARYDGSAATVPSGDTVNGTGSELNPSVRAIQGINSMSVIAPANCNLTLTLYNY